MSNRKLVQLLKRAGYHLNISGKTRGQSIAKLKKAAQLIQSVIIELEIEGRMPK